MEVKNLYRCSMLNCSMIFDTEEQLSAHKKKHEMSLSLTPSVYKNPFILDQTPTPTQFLSPISLELQDLQNDNPFEATFRKANSSHTSSNFVIPESSSLIANLPDSEVLNTPSIILPSEPATPISLKPSFSKKLSIKTETHCIENTDSLPFSPVEEIVQTTSNEEDASDAELPSESANFSSIVPPLQLISANVEKTKKKNTSKNVLQTSVITSVGNTAILKNSNVGVPTAVVVTRAPVKTVSSLSTSQVSVGVQQVALGMQQANQMKVQKNAAETVQPMYQPGTVFLSINLADGQIVQVPIITTNQPSTVATIAPQVTSTTTAEPSNAKLKLKQVLAQNQKNGIPVRKNNPPEISIDQNGSYELPDSSDGQLSSPPISPISSPKPGQNGRKRRDSVDDPDEKRKRSLERNRAAATRCRKKKKMWITSLEKKAIELERTNHQLQREVSILRNEVARLKTLLLAHKDCPVTLQQKEYGQEETETTYTTVRIITSPQNDLQCVPNTIEIAPASSDFLEMEVSSVQSNDSSLTSELSEVSSCRER